MTAHEAGKGPGRRAGADDAAYREGHDRIDWGAKGGYSPAPRYTKTIEQTDTGMVVAKVYNSAGARVGIEFFTWPCFSQRRRLERAHKWADKWIANCEELCIERDKPREIE